jgi:hypothetical protein
MSKTCVRSGIHRQHPRNTGLVKIALSEKMVGQPNIPISRRVLLFHAAHRS